VDIYLSKIYDRIKYSSKVLDLPDIRDAREFLPRNPDGLKWKIRPSKDLGGMVWHQELGWGTVDDVAAYHTSESFHLYKGGAESIAYTFAIPVEGGIVICNDLNKSTWSQGYKGRPGDENREFIAVMFEGCFDFDGADTYKAGEPTDLQILSALMLWRVCRDVWGWDESRLYGHFDFGKPSCPGSSLETIIHATRFNVSHFDYSSIRGRQAALQFIGCYDGQIDGIWGVKSKAGLIKFQETVGIQELGKWSMNTQRALKNVIARG